MDSAGREVGYASLTISKSFVESGHKRDAMRMLHGNGPIREMRDLRFLIAL